MNQRLKELLERVVQWPSGAQEDAVATLEAIEASVIANQGLTAEEQEAKLASLREMLRQSIARGGSYTPEDIDAIVEARFGESQSLRR